MGDLLAFVGSKMWFWLAASFATLIISVVSIYIRMKFGKSNVWGKVLIIPPLIVTVFLWGLFIISVLVVAWR